MKRWCGGGEEKIRRKKKNEMHVFLSQSKLGTENLVGDQLVDEHEYLKQEDQFKLLRDNLTDDHLSQFINLKN